MKTKLFLATLALPLAFGACTNDDFETASQQQGVNGELVEVGPGFVITANKGGDEAATKGQWIEALNGTFKFLNYAWWPNDKVDGATHTPVRDQIGLCWIGQTPGTNVYTNYRFQHAGWLNEDEISAEIEPCEPYAIENGYELVNDLTWDSNDPYKLKDGTSGEFNGTALNVTEGEYKEENNQFLTKDALSTGNKLNLNSAFFRTETETLFGGDYIAYLPFTSDMKDEGPIMAHSPKEVTVTLGNSSTKKDEINKKYAHLGSAIFMYANAPGLVGGTQASNFSFKHLSGLIRVNITVDNAWTDLNNLSYITLVDANSKFVTEVGLDAAKIVAEEKAASTGSALYVANTAEYTNMLTANIEGISNADKNVNAKGQLSIYIPALPTQTGALKVVLYDETKKKSAVYNAPAITVTPSGVADVNVDNVAAKNFTSTVVTTEQALFDLVSASGEAGAGDVVELLGDIELGTMSGTEADGWSVGKAVTIKGGKIIVPAKKKGTGFTWTVEANATIDSDIEIENKGCCDVNNGKMVIGSTTGSQKVKLNGTIDNYGDIEFVSGAAVATKNVTTITGKLNNHETLVKETGETNYATVTVKTLTEVNLEGAAVVNDGEITIEAVGDNSSDQDGLVNLDAKASITNNYYLTNAGNINNNGGKLVNKKDGWIIDRVSAQFGVTQPVNNGGEYVCEVNGQERLTEALRKSVTTRVRFISNEAQPNTNKDAKKDGTVYDETYGTTKDYSRAAFDLTDINRPDVDFEIAKNQNYDSEKGAIRFYSRSDNGLDVTIGSLIITAGRLDVQNFQKYDAAAKGYVDAALNINGNVVVDGENAYGSKLMCNIINVTGNINVEQLADKNQKVAIGGIQDANANNSYELSYVKVGGTFTVGNNEKNEVAAVAFENNNTTDILGSFNLYKNGTCDIKVATSTGLDNWAAAVWAGSLALDEGTWANSSKVKVGEHPLHSAE